MHTVDLTKMDLMEGWFGSDPGVKFRANFALFGGNGTEGSSTVFVELEPGGALGEHTDSAEEILLVIDGEVEMAVGGERARAGKGTLAVVPPMAPHGFRNVGDGVARVVGFFPAPGIVATFIEKVQPADTRVMVFGEAGTPAQDPVLA